MSSVTLAADLSNTEPFVESMFDSDVRNYSHIVSNAQNGTNHASFANNTSEGIVLNSWLAAWQSSQGDAASSPFIDVDYDLIRFLASYIKDNDLYFCRPSLTYQSMASGTDIAVYQSGGYDRLPFLTNGSWNYGEVNDDGSIDKGSYPEETVAKFLRYLYYGAHFVVISSSSDTSQSVDFFYDSFRNSGLTTSWDKVNSHYSASHWINTSGYYYLSITHDSEPSSDPLIAAFLAGKTSDTSKSNTFFQLEGWQSHFPYYDQWHTADYKAHQNTLWNYSTFGASPYSEKRSTTVFLAPSDFDLTPDSTTRMPLYEGAGSLQSWMNPALLIDS